MESRLEASEVLAIAEADASSVYGNLLNFRITRALNSDGSHVDYNLRDPYLKGGGPHYVIDPSTGEIVDKRYEQ